MSTANYILLAFQVVSFLIQLFYVYRTLKISERAMSDEEMKRYRDAINECP